MVHSTPCIHADNRLLQAKYDVTAWFYDILDFPWELQYRKWRPLLLEDVRGEVLEAGVGSGRNLRHYHSDVRLIGIDICRQMIRRAMKRSRAALCQIDLRQEDATLMQSIPDERFDWIFSTFLCCVMPDHLQPVTIRQFERVLKPGGRFRLLEMLYSKNPKERRKQERLTRLIEKLYGARFDRNTLGHLEQSEKLLITKTWFIKKDVYLVIEGLKKPTP